MKTTILTYFSVCCILALKAVYGANLLLPGFRGHELQASILSEEITATTYIVTCPTTVDAADCGIPGPGMTAIAGPSHIVLENINPRTDAYLSCEVKGTTYAFCHASKTISAEGTLAPKDLNWMEVPVLAAKTSEPSIESPSRTEIIINESDEFKRGEFSFLLRVMLVGLCYCVYVTYILAKYILTNHGGTNWGRL